MESDLEISVDQRICGGSSGENSYLGGVLGAVMGTGLTNAWMNIWWNLENRILVWLRETGGVDCKPMRGSSVRITVGWNNAIIVEETIGGSEN